MTSSSSQEAPTPKRDTAWKRDGRSKGVYWRKRANGSKSFGYYADGRIHSASSRQAALDGKAKASLRKSSGLPPPDTSKTINDYAELVLASKRRKLSAAALALDERAFQILLPEIGHLKPGACGPDLLEQLRADLADGRITGNKLRPRSIDRYLGVLGAVFRRALRDGAIPTNPLLLVEREQEERPRQSFEWSRKAIQDLIAASEYLAKQPPQPRHDYSGLIKVLVLTGLRISEALALRAQDIDLLGGRLHVRHSLTRKGELGTTKTKAGNRVVPLSDELVALFARLIPAEAEQDDFVFASRSSRKRPISYFNFRIRGFLPALEQAELDGKSITVHSLRHAAVSLMAAAGLTLVEVASIVGHSDASVTAKVYAHLFDRSDVEERVRAAQASISEGGAA